MTLVLDASITLAWIYQTDQSIDSIDSIFDQVIEEGAVVPALWPLEVAQLLETDVAVRGGRTKPAFRDATLADLALLPIAVDPETSRHAWQATLQLAIRRRLSLSQAAYLELAQRRRLPLATLDKELRAAATAEGSPLVSIVSA